MLQTLMVMAYRIHSLCTKIVGFLKHNQVGQVVPGDTDGSLYPTPKVKWKIY